MQKGTGVAMGIPLGAGIGTALGVAMDSIAIGLAIGVGIGIAIGTAFDAQACDDEGDKAQGDNPTNAARSAEKEAQVARVLEAARRKGSIGNDEVQALLGVSDATAERYLQELESEGKLRQEGIGRAIRYRPR